MRFIGSKRGRQERCFLSSLLLLPLVALSVGGCGIDSNSGAEDGGGTTPYISAPAFDLAGLDGQRHRLDDYSGRVLVLEFWATWCGPCRLQAEILERLYGEIDVSRVEFLAVSLGESAAVVRRFVEGDPFPYPVAIDPEETLGYALEVYALPTVVIVDPAGKVHFLRAGISDAATLRQAIAEASRETVAVAQG